MRISARIFNSLRRIVRLCRRSPWRIGCAIAKEARAQLFKAAELTVLPRDAKAFEVPAGHFFRIVGVKGSQAGDLNLWKAHDLAERFYSGKARASAHDKSKHW